MHIVAVTGGIGAGKSTVTRELERSGAVRLDGDQVARDVVDPATAIGSATLAQVRDLLGDAVFLPDGSLDRSAVAELIFASDDLRSQYNRILFPAIERETVAQLEMIQHAAPEAIVVHEIPLYTGRALPWTYAHVVTVEADPQVRAERLIAARGYSPQHAAERIAAQGASAPREAIADTIIRTDGTLDETITTVKNLWAELTQRFLTSEASG